MIGKRWIAAWAAGYPIDDDAGVEALAEKNPKYADMRLVVRWKSARSSGYFDRNSRAEVETKVKSALSDHDDISALRTLMSLHGVKERVGSAILTAYRPDHYTVMDRRAYSTLVACQELPDMRGRTWLQTWQPYLQACRRLAKRTGLDLRTVDRALFRANGRAELP